MTKDKYPMDIKLKIKKIAFLPTSTYHTTRYDQKTVFIAGSDWDRKKIQKPKKDGFAKGVLFRVNDDGITTFPMNTDMLYIVEVVSQNILFLGAKTEKNTFQLFSVKDETVIKQKSDLQGGGCYGTLYVHNQKELLMNTRNGYLKNVDIETLKTKESVKITPKNERLWQIHYVEEQDIIYTSDYLGNLYKIQKQGFKIIKKVSLFDIYKHNDNHGNPPSLWGLSYHNGIIIGGDRFGGITVWDNDLNLISHKRLKKDMSIIKNPNLQFPSSEMESIMSVKMINDKYFLIGSRWGNVFLLNLVGGIKKIIDVPMGIQKENSAFTMDKVITPSGIEIFITFGDGQIYSVLYQKED